MDLGTFARCSHVTLGNQCPQPVARAGSMCSIHSCPLCGRDKKRYQAQCDAHANPEISVLESERGSTTSIEPSQPERRRVNFAPTKSPPPTDRKSPRRRRSGVPAVPPQIPELLSDPDRDCLVGAPHENVTGATAEVAPRRRVFRETYVRRFMHQGKLYEERQVLSPRVEGVPVRDGVVEVVRMNRNSSPTRAPSDRRRSHGGYATPALALETERPASPERKRTGEVITVALAPERTGSPRKGRMEEAVQHVIYAPTPESTRPTLPATRETTSPSRRVSTSGPHERVPSWGSTYDPSTGAVTQRVPGGLFDQQSTPYAAYAATLSHRYRPSTTPAYSGQHVARQTSPLRARRAESVSDGTVRATSRAVRPLAVDRHGFLVFADPSPAPSPVQFAPTSSHLYTTPEYGADGQNSTPRYYSEPGSSGRYATFRPAHPAAAALDTSPVRQRPVSPVRQRPVAQSPATPRNMPAIPSRKSMPSPSTPRGLVAPMYSVPLSPRNAAVTSHHGTFSPRIVPQRPKPTTPARQQGEKENNQVAFALPLAL